MAVPGHRLDRMFNPKTVAVIGDKGPGYMWLRNNLAFKENGGNLYSVQIAENEIPGIEELGVTNVKSLADIPEPIDYAVVAVPRHISPYVLKDLITADAGGAAFFTSGFAETGEELGINLQQQITEMAREASFNLVGPNCMGLYLPKVGVRFNADAEVTTRGRIGFLSQSGTHAIMFSLVAGAHGLALSRAASFGNAVVLDISDYLDYLLQDDETDVIAMYVEGVRDGRRFFETLKRATAVKPVVVWKGGQTSAGARATMSHTGSLATSQAVWDGMIRQCGAIATNNLDETVDVMQMLVHSKRPAGPRMALMAMTGGQSVSITDAFEKAGLRVPTLTDESYAELGEFFNVVGGSYRNPFDIAGTVQGNVEVFRRIFDIVERDPNVDAVALEMSAMFGARQWRDDITKLTGLLDLLQERNAQSAKPHIAILHPAHEEAYVATVRHEFYDRGIPAYMSFERAAGAMARFVSDSVRRAQA